jgi:hypothetical protein
VARVEIERSVLAEGLDLEKVKALQLSAVEISNNGSKMILEGPDIVIARAWIVDPEAWKGLASSVVAGHVEVFDATQLKVGG